MFSFKNLNKVCNKISVSVIVIATFFVCSLMILSMRLDNEQTTMVFVAHESRLSQLFSSLFSHNDFYCKETPFVKCSNTSNVTFVDRSYSKLYGEFQRQKYNRESDRLPGLFVKQTVKPRTDDAGRKYNATHENYAPNMNTHKDIGAESSRQSVNHTFRISCITDDKVGPNFRKCPYSNCEWAMPSNIGSDVDLVMAEAQKLDLDRPLPRRWSHQMYVLFGVESPVNFFGHGDIFEASAKDSPWLSAFNFTQSYHRSSDIFTPYGNLEYVEPATDATNLTEVTLRKNRTALWVVSNCRDKTGRWEYVQEMRKYIDVDILGKCAEPCPSTHAFCGKDMNQYRFYLAFENSYCTDYVTEKFFKIFDAHPVVPVVRGGADYDLLFPSGTFVNARHFPGARELALHLRHLSENPAEYTRMLRNTLMYRRGPTQSSLQGHCNICEFLNRRDDTAHQFYDIRRWYRDDCKLPDTTSLTLLVVIYVLLILALVVSFLICCFTGRKTRRYIIF